MGIALEQSFEVCPKWNKNEYIQNKPQKGSLNLVYVYTTSLLPHLKPLKVTIHKSTIPSKRILQHNDHYRTPKI